MVTRALVLGGGGPVGVAWETGLAAGLAERGIDLGLADRIIGTSAGSFVGAQLASRRSPAALLAAQQDLVAREAQPREGGTKPAGPAPDLAPLMQFMAERPANEDEALELRKKIGAFSLGAKTIPEEAFIGGFGHMGSGKAEWPTRYACTAVDAEDGRFVLWEQASGIDIGRGIASSCSVPGIYPAITINGRRYIDGGMRSATNFDLAKGYDRVIAVAVVPKGGASFMRGRIDPEIDVLTRAGAQVALIMPDEASQEAFGPNLMDPSRRAQVLAAAVEQGRAEAEALHALWD